MPFCYLYTNKKESELKDGAEQRLSKAIAETLGKPLDSMTVMIIPGLRMVSQNSTNPACYLTISAVGVFDAERNSKYTPVIRKTLASEFDLPGERCLIVYKDLEMDFIGLIK